MPPTARLNAVLAALISITGAASLWIWAAAASQRVEAWDGPYYFSRVVPALWAVAVVCGLLAPRMPWRWPAIMYATQFILMMARTEGSVGPLAPLGLVMMGVLAAITMVPAYLGSFLRYRRDRSGQLRHGTRG
jgi:hypothetical protein